MTTINPISVQDQAVAFFGNNAFIYTWLNLTFATLDQTSFLPGPGWADRSLQVSGTFGSGGTLTIEGSNDGASFFTLHDPFSNLLNISTPGIYQITEICAYIRGRVVAGDGSTSLNVTGMFVNHAGLI